MLEQKVTTGAAIEPGAASRTAAMLQEQLAELITLTLLAKHYHWNVYGSGFRSVHLEMDEITAAVRLWMDTVAERIVTLGIPANGQADVAAAAEIPAAPNGPIKDVDASTGMADRLSASAQRARQRAKDVADIDPVSESVLLSVLEGMEKEIWMLRASRD